MCSNSSRPELSFWRNWGGERGSLADCEGEELQQICLWELDKSSREFISICPWLCMLMCVFEIYPTCFTWGRMAICSGLDCLSGLWRTHSTSPPTDIYPPNYITVNSTHNQWALYVRWKNSGRWFETLKNLDQYLLYLFTCNGMALW